MPGTDRCRLHGGMSTGPRTPEGKARCIAGMKIGRARWLADLKTQGKRAPCGRKKGGHNAPKVPVSDEERERAAYDAECDRAYRDFELLGRDERKARRVRRRQDRQDTRRKLADHARRQERAARGLSYWTPQEQAEIFGPPTEEEKAEQARKERRETLARAFRRLMQRQLIGPEVLAIGIDDAGSSGAGRSFPARSRIIV
jgi:hypothetical protein